MRELVARVHGGRWAAALVTCLSVSMGSCVTGTASSRGDPLWEAREALSGRDYDAAFGLFRDLADQGHPEAEYRIGWMHFNGLCVSRDLEAGAWWFLLAAEAGFPQAQYHVGWLYPNGRGVPLDLEEGVRWYRMAAGQEHVEGLYAMGWAHHGGRGVPQDQSWP